MPDPMLFASKPLPDGRRVDVYPLTFGRARLSTAPTLDDETFYLDSW